LDWKRLADILSEVKAVYTELLELSEEKREAVFERDVQRLDAVVRQEQAAVTNLNHWEKQRLVCMDAPGNDQLVRGQSPSDAPTLLFFADNAPDGERERLHTLHGELSGLLRELTKRNAENKALIESRLEYVQFAVDALTAEQTAGLYGSGYGRTPPESGMERKTIMDLKG
jgi:flagellar biosynthesis/type III secretory pathway chaperone